MGLAKPALPRDRFTELKQKWDPGNPVPRQPEHRTRRLGHSAHVARVDADAT